MRFFKTIILTLVVSLGYIANINAQTRTATEGYVDRGISNAMTRAWQNPASSTNWLWSSDGTQITITNYNFSSLDVVIPEKLDNLPVTRFEDYVFSTINKNIKTIYGPSITELIGGASFYGCTNLTSVMLLSVTNIIGKQHFYNCISLNSVYFSVNKPILEYAESNLYTYIPANQVTNYIINPIATGWSDTFGGMPVIRSDIYCDNLYTKTDFLYYSNNNTITITGYVGTANSVIIPQTLNKLPVVYVTGFADSSITSIIFPQGVIKIGDFGNCTNLTSVFFSDTITDFSAAVFEECGIKTLTLPNSEINWGSKSAWFNDCYSLTNITIPNKVKTLPSSIFYDCTNLLTVSIGSGITSIGDRAFKNCYNLQGAYFSGNAPTLLLYQGTIYPFETCTNSTMYYLSGMTNFGTVFGTRPTAIYGPKVVANIIVNDTTNAPDVYGNTTINIAIPTNGWSNASSTTNWLYTSNEYEIILTNYLGSSNAVIPDIINGLPVTTLGTNLFAGTMGVKITSISGGNNVQKIQYYAFYLCSKLTSLYLPNVTSIDSAGIVSCNTLKTIILPRLKTLANQSIKSCAVTLLDLPNLEATIGSNALDGNNSLVTVNLPSVKSLDTSAFANCAALKFVYLPSITNIGANAFYATAVKGVYFSGNAPTTGATIYNSVTAGTVTNYVLSPTATGWSTTLGGQPVVRPRLYSIDILYPVTVTSTTNITIDASLMSEAMITATNDITILAPSNPTDGKDIKWRFYASGADRTITWPTNVFRILSSSSISNTVVVSNGTYSVFVTEYAAPTTNWLLWDIK